AEIGLSNLPPAVQNLSLAEFFCNYDNIWQSRHRGGDAGYTRCTILSEDHVTMTVKSPYPIDLFYGAFYGYARYFCPKDKTFSVAYDHPFDDEIIGQEI